MPVRGGPAGKVGDRYEILWAVDAALRVVAGRAEWIVYESLDPESSRGIEFRLHSSGVEVECWSVKRQTSKAHGWTSRLLTQPDEQGRSILGDLIEHVQRDARNVAVFASMLAAPTLEELRDAADTGDVFERRLDQTPRLKAIYESDILPLFSGRRDRAREFLTRLRIRTQDEVSLRIKSSRSSRCSSTMRMGQRSTQQQPVAF